MKKHYIQLPKGYLSYSQISRWLNDKQGYIDLYMDGRSELQRTNYGQQYGKMVADALEKQEETGDLLTDSAMLLLPKYDIADKEIVVEMKTKSGWIKLLIKPDSLDEKTKAIREYKTGKQPWTQKKADEHLQLKIYATGIYLKYKIVPEVGLDWIQTEQIGSEIKPTGHVESFTVNITLKDILETMALITRVAKEIEIEFAHHVTDPRIANY